MGVVKVSDIGDVEPTQSRMSSPLRDDVRKAAGREVEPGPAAAAGAATAASATGAANLGSMASRMCCCFADKAESHDGDLGLPEAEYEDEAADSSWSFPLIVFFGCALVGAVCLVRQLLYIRRAARYCRRRWRWQLESRAPVAILKGRALLSAMGQ